MCYCDQKITSETSGTSGTYGRCKNLILNGTPLFGRKLVDFVKMDVKETSCKAMYWIHLAQDCPMAISFEDGNQNLVP
jgi:hypothetical protein